LATFFFVAPAFFLATDSSSKKTKNKLSQDRLVRSSRLDDLGSTTDTKRPL
jgi:hypothetical protein